MDLVSRMAIHRAHAALGLAVNVETVNEKIKTFNEMRQGIAFANTLGEVHFDTKATDCLQDFHSKFLSLGDAVFADAPYKALISAYLAALAPFSVLDSIKKYAQVLSPLFPQAITASGWVADETQEGSPKAVKQPSLAKILTPPHKVASIVVWSDLLDKVPELTALMERLANDALVRGQNLAVFNVALNDSPTNVAGTASGNALTDLEKLISTLPGGRGAVVATSWANVRKLSISTARGPAFTGYGGTFVEGVDVVPTDDLPAGAAWLGIEASQVSISDAGVQLRPARHANVNISDAPGTPNGNTVFTSLWQANLRALATERLFQLAIPDEAVAIIQG